MIPVVFYEINRCANIEIVHAHICRVSQFWINKIVKVCCLISCVDLDLTLECTKARTREHQVVLTQNDIGCTLIVRYIYKWFSNDLYHSSGDYICRINFINRTKVLLRQSVLSAYYHVIYSVLLLSPLHAKIKLSTIHLHNYALLCPLE